VIKLVGYFGNVVFQASRHKTLTFSDLKHSSAGRWEKHNVIGEKPVSEFIGPDLDTISLTILLNGSNGVKPRKEMERWIRMVNEGYVDILVIGHKPLGRDQWSVKSVSEAWDVIFNKGELYSGKIDVTLEEYIEVI
jgi:phage protein U